MGLPKHFIICVYGGFLLLAQMTISPAIQECQVDWKEGNSACYSVVLHDWLSWNQSESACQATGANLASISSANEQEFFTKNIHAWIQTTGPHDGVWIGGYDSENVLGERIWKYTDGSPWYNGITWYPGEPNNYGGKEGCLAIMSTAEAVGKVNDLPCENTGQSKGYICKKAKVTTTQAVSTVSTQQTVVLGDTCSDNNDCSTIANSKCDTTPTPSVCACAGGHKVSSGSCIAKVVGDSCSDNAHCPYSNSACTSSTCACASGYKDDGGGGCTANGLSCLAEKDDRGMEWPSSLPGTKTILACHYPLEGTVTRQCSQEGMYLSPKFRCTSKDIAELLRNFTLNSTLQVVKTAVSLANITSHENKTLQEGDLIASATILELLATSAARLGTVIDSITDSFFETANNLIDSRNKDCWQSLMDSEEDSAIRILSAVDKYGTIITQLRNTSLPTMQISTDNIIAEFGSAGKCLHSMTFPSRTSETPKWARTSVNNIEIPCTSVLVGARYAGAYYRHVSEILPVKLKDNATPTRNIVINSAVMSFTLHGYSGNVESALEVTLTFEVFESTMSNPLCSFWNVNVKNGTGAWDTEGCSLKSKEGEKMVCFCDHLTNFAVLMSPVEFELTEAQQTSLSTITFVGCGMSGVCLFLTIVLHVVYWRLVAKDGPGKTVILIQLCSVLLIAYILFLGGVKMTDNKALCTTIAILLHYIFLVVFFTMLAVGLNLAFSVQFPFAALTGNAWKWFTAIAWIIPGIIVAISLAVTRLNGYGGTNSCWLSVHSGLIWAFITPVTVVILMNVMIIIFVISKLFQTKAFERKSDKEKAKAGVRSICVLLPVMGTTWLIGVFSFDESQIAFQYAFAILNSVQGVLIFLLHSLLHKQVKEGVKTSLKRLAPNRAIYFGFARQETEMTTGNTHTSSM